MAYHRPMTFTKTFARHLSSDPHRSLTIYGDVNTQEIDAWVKEDPWAVDYLLLCVKADQSFIAEEVYCGHLKWRVTRRMKFAHYYDAYGSKSILVLDVADAAMDAFRGTRFDATAVVDPSRVLSKIVGTEIDALMVPKNVDLFVADLDSKLEAMSMDIAARMEELT